MKLAHISLIAVVLAGCPSEAPENACTSNQDCTDATQICIQGSCQDFVDCQELQASAGACNADQECKLTETGATCVALTGCRVTADCAAGQFCVNGECGGRPTTAVASCEILNSQRVYSPGASIEVLAAAYDASGRYIPYQEYTVTTGAGFTVSGHTLVASAGDGNLAAVNATVTVTFGSTPCEATFTNIGSISAGSRLTLYSTAPAGMVGSTRIGNLVAADFFFTDSAGTKIDPSDFAVDAANGVYKMSTPPTAVAVTVAADNYNYTTVFWGGGVSTPHDIALPLEAHDPATKKGETNGFAGAPDFSAYDVALPQAPGAGGQLTGAYAGGSLPLSALLNFNLNLFAGDTANFAQEGLLGLVTSTMSCTTPIAANAMGSIPLPRALFIANANNAAVGPNCAGYAARVTPGRRIGWSLGVKLPVTALTGLIANGSSLSIDAIIGAVLPLADRIALGVDALTPSYLERKSESLWETFVVKPLSAQQSDADFKITNIKPANKLVNIVNFSNPGGGQDFFTGATANDKFTGFISLVAAISPAYGIVPIGFGAGFDGKDAAGNSGTDGKLERLSQDPRFADDSIHTRHTLLQTDISDSDVVGVLIGSNLQDLAKDDGDATKKSRATRIKGIVNRDRTRKIGWDRKTGALGNMANAVVGYFSPPNPTFSHASNVLTLPAITKVDGGAEAKAVIIRVDREDDSTTRSWNIIVLPSALESASTGLQLNTTGMDDIFAGTKPGMDMAIVALDFNDTKSFEERLSPSYGKDLELVAGDVKSFSVYLDHIDQP